MGHGSKPKELGSNVNFRLGWQRRLLLIGRAHLFASGEKERE